MGLPSPSRLSIGVLIKLYLVPQVSVDEHQYGGPVLDTLVHFHDTLAHLPSSQVDAMF